MLTEDYTCMFTYFDHACSKTSSNYSVGPRTSRETLSNIWRQVIHWERFDFLQVVLV